MSIQVVYDLISQNATPPPREIRYIPIYRLFLSNFWRGRGSILQILVINNSYRQCKYVFKKCQIIFDAHKLIYIYDIECYLYALLIIYCFFRQNL